MAPPAFGHGVIACAAKTRVVFNPSSVMAGEGAARPYCRSGTFRIDGYAIRFPVDGEHRRGSVRSCAACAPTPWRGRKKAGKRMSRMHDACRMEKIMPSGILPFRTCQQGSRTWRGPSRLGSMAQ
ncbi:hypothetical protein [Komagataeibacter intermedius]|uniref:hypothetical protein n=1 Tax=Komagataeibacter intermedius TaxID=66229 RepID=UPI0018FEB8AF|nr:hypothetical protein [Komagataeibacter intermedius]